jgi:hypothetical protein
MSKVFEAGFSGSNKTLIAPYEALVHNQLLTGHVLTGAQTLPIVSQK